MNKRIIFFVLLVVSLAGLLLCTGETVPCHYHSDDNGFSFTVIEGKESSLLIFQNQDTVIYDGDLNSDYSCIQFVIPDSIKTIYLLDCSNKNRIKRAISHSFEIVVVKGYSLNSIEDKFSTAKHTNSENGYCSYYGTLCERGGGTSFNYCRNGKHRSCLYPL